MENKFKLIIDSFGKDRFKFDESLKDYTALGVGGKAKLFFVAFSAQELVKIIDMSRQLNLPYFLFGSGSKIMISDQGFDGLVIKNRTKNIQTVSVKGKVTKHGLGISEALIEVESGVSINMFIQVLQSQGLSTQGFSLMQGSIGGNLFFSKLLQSMIKSIKVLDLNSQIDEIAVESLSPKKHVILSAVFRIKANQL